MSRAAPPKKKTVRLAWEPDRNRKSDDITPSPPELKRQVSDVQGTAFASACFALFFVTVAGKSTSIQWGATGSGNFSANCVPDEREW
jgi:hypothetical protein